MSKFKVGDKVAVRSGGYGKIVAIKPNGMYEIEGGGMEGSFPESKLVKVANSCSSSNPVVQNALKVRNADEYVVRKSLSTSKWLLSRRSKSLGDSGETKVFSSEQEARDFAKKNGLKVVNAEIAKNSIDDGSVLVSFQTPTANGLDKVQSRMTASQFREWLSKIGLSSKEHEAWESLMKSDFYAFMTNPIRVSVKAL